MSLQRDLLILMAERVQVEQLDGSKIDMTEPEERRLIFYIMFGGHQKNLIQLSMGDDSSLRNVAMTDEPIGEFLSRLENMILPLRELLCNDGQPLSKSTNPYLWLPHYASQPFRNQCQADVLPRARFEMYASRH